MKERPYQGAALEGARVELRRGARAILLVMPTGTGKSILFRKIIAGVVNKGKRALLLVQGKNLVNNAAKHLRSLGVSVGVEMGDDKVGPVQQLGLMDGGPQIVVASKDSMIRRLKHYPRGYFRCIVTDEAHHILAKSYLTILEHFGVSVPQLDKKGKVDRALPKTGWVGDGYLIGLTATPDRGDHGDIMQVFETVGFRYGIKEAIGDGWLVPIEQEFCTLKGLDLQGVRKSAGDLRAEEIEQIIRPLLVPICKGIVETADGRPTLIYNPLVTMAQATTLHLAGTPGAGRCVTIHGELDRSDYETMLGRRLQNESEGREALFQAMARREVWAFSSVGTLTEGVDIPCATIGAMLRFTLSRPLYAQIMGRILRPADEIAHALNDMSSAAERRAAIAASSKPKAIMLDFVGNSGKHKLIHVADIIGEDEDDATMNLARGNMEKGMRDPFAAIEQAKQTLAEIVSRTTGTELERIVVDPFALFSIKAKKDPMGTPPTEKQLEALIDCGAVKVRARTPEGRIKAMEKLKKRFDILSAQSVLDEHKRRITHGLASIKMVRALVEHKIPPERARTMTWHEGRAAMSELERLNYQESVDWIRRHSAVPARPPNQQEVA